LLALVCRQTRPTSIACPASITQRQVYPFTFTFGCRRRTQITLP
jgi:hypothetical protein